MACGCCRVADPGVRLCVPRIAPSLNPCPCGSRITKSWKFMGRHGFSDLIVFNLTLDPTALPHTLSWFHVRVRLWTSGYGTPRPKNRPCLGERHAVRRNMQNTSHPVWQHTQAPYVRVHLFHPNNVLDPVTDGCLMFDLIPV